MISAIRHELSIYVPRHEAVVNYVACRSFNRTLQTSKCWVSGS